RKDPVLYQPTDADPTGLNNALACSSVPPPLLREGEKTQPDWLFRFLKNPSPIRPVTVLRMPRFNMSDDEAMALVNYFAAVDKMGNPGTALNYPYFTMPQRDERYIERQTANYVKQLADKKPPAEYAAWTKELNQVWAQATKELLADAERRLKAAEAR